MESHLCWVIAGYILRPNIGLRTLISRIQAEMDFESWKHRSIGVHLRLGDKRSNSILKIPQVVLPYLNEYEVFALFTDINVFIASDLASAVSLFEDCLRLRTFEFTKYLRNISKWSITIPLRVMRSSKHLEFRLGETSPYDEVSHYSHGLDALKM